ncbi:unnamed protein product [Protopolystoma xenopodis]|uniref:CLEC16A/TT9 C-terminal domain-containing protein n=1 Tax=Protopolystoma xenopodis TaxID=117903 RepID=A0A3S5BRB1_9PLAT|nr:unnamed protein product [Protopolystoma xenopodis]
MLLFCFCNFSSSKSERRYVVIGNQQIVLIEPDSKEFGCGVVTFAGLLQDVEVHCDIVDSRCLYIIVLYPGQLGTHFLSSSRTSPSSSDRAGSNHSDMCHGFYPKQPPFAQIPPTQHMLGSAFSESIFGGSEQLTKAVHQQRQQHHHHISALQPDNLMKTGKPPLIGGRVPLLCAKFMFEDHIRCMAANKQLIRGRENVRRRKLAKIARLLDFPDDVVHDIYPEEFALGVKLPVTEIKTSSVAPAFLSHQAPTTSDHLLISNPLILSGHNALETLSSEKSHGPPTALFLPPHKLTDPTPAKIFGCSTSTASAGKDETMVHPLANDLAINWQLPVSSAPSRDSTISNLLASIRFDGDSDQPVTVIGPEIEYYPSIGLLSEQFLCEHPITANHFNA